MVAGPAVNAADFEPLLNGKLAELLRGQGVKAEAEQRRKGSTKQVDVAVTVEHIIVALEAEINNPRGAWKDADKRLQEAAAGKVAIHEAVAVVYPAGLTVEAFNTATVISWAVLPDTAFDAGDVASLGAVLLRLPQQHGDLDRLARDINNALDLAVDPLPDTLKRQACGALDLPVTRKVNGIERDVTTPATKRALLLIACASMFHARLDAHLDSEKRPDVHAQTGKAYTGPWPPKKLPECVSAVYVVDELNGAWQAILALDYRPIFESACRVLNAPARDPVWADSVSRVTAAGQRAASHAATARHDLLGRVFHWLLDTARYDGSYYTSSTSAALLAELAIREQDLSPDLSQWRLIDPACGTGTLLMAAAQRIHDLRDPATEAEDAVTLLEHVITGLDINTSACHMAATTLGLLSPSTKFHNMNITRMPFGAQNPTAAKDNKLDPRLGSLELLDPKASEEDKDGQRRLRTDWSSGTHIDTDKFIDTDPNSQHLVIMNPPYTRDSLRHDQLDPREEKAMKAREKKIMTGRAGHGSSGSTIFLDLAEHLANLHQGTVAVVLPLAGAANPAGLEARKLLATKFHIEWVIASHDPERIWFSENTTISEMLVVARRHKNDPAHRPLTKFVRLHRNPRTAAEAITLAKALAADADHPQATIETRPAKLVAEGSWAPLGITSAYLVAIATKIASGKLFAVVPLGKVARVGPAGRRIRDAFTQKDHADAEGRRALWQNDTQHTQILQAAADSYIHAKRGKENLADSYWEQRSNLLLCTEARLDTARVVAVRLTERVVGSRWVPVYPIEGAIDDPSRCTRTKALAVWWNSTPGLITLIAAATPKTLSRPELPLDTMRSLPVPVLDAEKTKILADAFDDSALAPLQTLADAATDPVRAKLDAAVSDALGWSAEETARARSELSREPSTGGEVST